jgi:hypothetical protein
MSTPKTETPATPSFPSFPSFDPLAIWTASQQAFARMMTEGYGHYAAFESQMTARALAAVSTWAQLSQDAISYGAQLSSEARKLGLDAMTKLRTAA